MSGFCFVVRFDAGFALWLWMFITGVFCWFAFVLSALGWIALVGFTMVAVYRFRLLYCSPILGY